MPNFVVLTVALLIIPACLDGLHRFVLYLEQRDVIYYWHKRHRGGCSYNPLQEMIQPQIRHSHEVREQRIEDGSESGYDKLLPPQD